MTMSENRPWGTQAYGALAGPENLQTDDQKDEWLAAVMGMTVEDLRRDFYDPNAPELSDEEINRLLDCDPGAHRVDHGVHGRP